MHDLKRTTGIIAFDLASGSVGVQLSDFVGAVESGARDDMSGYGVDCIGEGELIRQVYLGVQGEELENVGVWSV